MATNYTLPTANDVFGSFIGPGVGSFEFAGPITGNNCGTNWTYASTPTNEYYYLAVPSNSLFTEDLTSAGALQYACNGLTYQASSRKAMVINGENYWLYKLTSGTGTASTSYGFK